MKTEYVIGVVVACALSAPASAGSLERNTIPLELLFDTGNLVQFAFTAPQPDLSAAPFGSSGSVFDAFSTVGLAYRGDITDDLSLGVFFNQPFGANNGYESGPIADYSIDFQSNELAIVLSYEINQNLTVFGGLRAIESELNLSVPPAAGYTLQTGSDVGYGYLIGASYAIPERGARVTLTYQSAVQHSFESTEFGSTSFGNTEAELPQSIRLDGEIALNSSTLLFGSVDWTDYSNFDVAAPGFSALVVPGSSVIDYLEDNLILSIGLGRSISDDWSLFGIYEVQTPDGEQTALRPYDGSQALTLGARFERGQINLTGGVQYRQFGDTIVDGVAFTGNDAVSPFFRVAYSF
jgi:long-subunit fatty acid transport protein